jgi:hypothetical protein
MGGNVQAFHREYRVVSERQMNLKLPAVNIKALARNASTRIDAGVITGCQRARSPSFAFTISRSLASFASSAVVVIATINTAPICHRPITSESSITSIERFCGVDRSANVNVASEPPPRQRRLGVAANGRLLGSRSKS